MKLGSFGSLKRGALALCLLLAWAHGCSMDEGGTLNAVAGSAGNAGSGGANAGGGNVGKGGSGGSKGGSTSNPGGQGGEAATAGLGTEGGAGPNGGAGGEAGGATDGGSSGSGEGGAGGQGGAPGADCTDSAQCMNSAQPVCANGFCVAGVDECNSDDASEPGDDGPAGAVSLDGAVGVAVMIGGTVCSRPSAEADYFSVTVQQGQGISLSIDWVDNSDLELLVLDANGAVIGMGGQQHPESIQLSYLAAGTYYVRVTRSGPSNPSTTDYTVTSIRTQAATCTTSADCAAAYGTQFYRGSCSGGVCRSIAAGSRAAGSPCDTDNDCQSGLCSYQPFESDAQKSVCTIACTSTPDCASLGANFRCTTGAGGNRCIPSCTSDLECGANVTSQVPDFQQPWDYWNCDVDNGSCAR